MLSILILLHFKQTNVKSDAYWSCRWREGNIMCLFINVMHKIMSQRRSVPNFNMRKCFNKLFYSELHHHPQINVSVAVGNIPSI